MDKKLWQKAGMKYALVTGVQNGIRVVARKKGGAPVLSSIFAAGGALVGESVIYPRWGNTAASIVEAGLATGSLLLYAKLRPKKKYTWVEALLTGSLIGAGDWFARGLGGVTPAGEEANYLEYDKKK